MFKKLMILFLFMCFSCNTNTEIGFKGKWISIEKYDNKKVIVISRKGKNYLVNMNRTEKLSAFLENDTLKIITKNDTVEATINEKNLLIIENESYKKEEDNFSNPGAGNF